MTHTPGPWTYRPNPDDKDGQPYWIDAPTGLNPDIIDEVTGPPIANAYSEATARLIAAAPELLEACQLMKQWDESDDDIELLSKAASFARAAIKKATLST